MKKVLIILGLAAALAGTARAQTSTVQGYCQTGGVKVQTQGVNSTTMVQGSYPNCTVTVYQTGTGTLATLFSSAGGAALSNPFVAPTNGQWRFWASTSACYDVILTGGVPLALPSPQTYTDVCGGGGGGGGGGVTSWNTRIGAVTLTTADVTALGLLANSTSGNAATATALAGTPTLCSTGQAPTGILPNGNVTGCAAIGGGAVSSVFGRTGAVTAASGDYSSFYCPLTGCTMTGPLTAGGGTYQAGFPNSAAPSGLASGNQYLQAQTSDNKLHLYTGVTDEGSLCSAGNGQCPGAALPTAGFPGQIISSTTAGSTYAVQPQIFYSQSGDTIASIETECASACTYVVTAPQTITLAADHTLSANVFVRFNAGGLWTVNGAHTLTFTNTPTSDSLTQHLAGTSTVAGLTGDVPVEWFGAVGDGTITLGGSGTVNTTPIQKTINAIASGCALLGPHVYTIDAALSITTNYNGVCGTNFGYTSVSASGISVLAQKTAGADFIDVAGVSAGAPIFFNRFHDIILQRVVLPTGTATGISLNFAEATDMNHVESQDNIRNFYFHDAQSVGPTQLRNLVGGWGFSVVTTYTTESLYNEYLDSADGVGENTIFLAYGGLAQNTGGSTTTYGTYITGTAINDVDLLYPSCDGGISYCLYVNYTGTGVADSEADIHVNQPIFDSCGISCVKVVNLSNLSGQPTVTVQDGYMLVNSNSLKVLDCENSRGLSILGNQFLTIGPAGDTAIYENGCSGGIIAHNKAEGFDGGAFLDFVSTVNTTVAANNISGGGGGPMSTGFAFDSGSLNNDVTGNTIGVNVTTPITGTPVGTTPTFLATGSKLNGSPICSTANGACAGVLYPQVSSLIDGVGGANSEGVTILGAGGKEPSNFYQVAASQTAMAHNMHLTSGGYTYTVNGAAGQYDLSDDGSELTMYLALCPVGTAGGTPAIGSTCVNEVGSYSASGQRHWFNPDSTTPTYPANAALVANPSANWYVRFNGDQVAQSYNTLTNCASSASPAVCGSAASGSVAIATSGTTLTVNSSAVTANSQILLMGDSSLGSRLGITCATDGASFGPFNITARSAGTSFTITNANPDSTGQTCLNYTIVN